MKIISILLLALLIACNPAKKATKLYNKAKEKHLPTVALLSRSDWPCGKTKADTVVNYLPGRTDTVTRDQIVTVDCPDTSRSATPGSVIKVPVKAPCACPEKQPDTLYRYITQFEKDPRDSIVYTEQLQVKDKQISKAEAGRNTWRTIALAIAVIFAVYVILSRIFRLF